MDHADRIFKTIGLARPSGATLIACLYSGVQLPNATAPMPRSPAPDVGQPLSDLAVALDEALALNAAVHDGAIMIGRENTLAPYSITGWSFRLFPASKIDFGAVNRGSAFHSGLAMSREPDVDKIYLVSAGRAYRFEGGEVVEI